MGENKEYTFYPPPDEDDNIAEELDLMTFSSRMLIRGLWKIAFWIFKSRDITLLTKVHLVKTMVFPVVIYGCGSWTIKKAEC